MAERILPKVAISTSLLGFFTCPKALHGTDGFTSPPKEGVLRIFSPENPTPSAGFEPANLGTKGQHSTSRPPKPLQELVSEHNYRINVTLPFAAVAKQIQGNNKMPFSLYFLMLSNED
jgi:hypothetical protein